MYKVSFLNEKGVIGTCNDLPKVMFPVIENSAIGNPTPLPFFVTLSKDVTFPETFDLLITSAKKSASCSGCSVVGKTDNVVTIDFKTTAAA